MIEYLPEFIRQGHADPVLPAIVLDNPKFPHNVGATIRAASCFGISQVWYTGNRMNQELARLKRLPREERMKGYQEVELVYDPYPLKSLVAEGAVPVAVELRNNSERLPDFVHPEKAIYIFGPEDGSINRALLPLCHRFVMIPSRHCLNLSAAVYVVLYDRAAKSEAR